MYIALFSHFIPCGVYEAVYIVGHVVVTDPAVSAIANVILGQQVLLVQAPLGAVRRRALTAAQYFGNANWSARRPACG